MRRVKKKEKENAMSESSDYTPGPWAGHDFGAARQQYDKHAGRSYAVASATGVAATDLVPLRIATDSIHPLLIACDVSGSMEGWPATIFAKLPYLDHEIRTEYLGEDAETSFAAISDTGDSYPFQVQPFTKGTQMTERLQKLVITNGGAGPGNSCEAHGLAMLYALHNVDTPRAMRRPPFIIITDEMPYDPVSQEDANRYAKVKLEGQRVSIAKVMEELKVCYSVYLVLKPYGSERLVGDQLVGNTKTVYGCWERLLGADRIALLPEADRVVDVIFGLLAKDAGRTDYFRKEIESRQRPEQVDTVYRALKTVHALPAEAGGPDPGKPSGRSIMHRPTDGKPSKKLV